MCRSVRPAIYDHAPVQRFDPLAGGTLAKAGHEGMQKAGAAGKKQGPGKGKGHALMLEIAFADGLRMADKQARKHGHYPVSVPKQYIALFFEIIPI